MSVTTTAQDRNPLADELLDAYEEMPPQLKTAARFVLAHPREVALLSMRDQAAKAGVSHSTMVRLAQFVGLEGYEELRNFYRKVLREQAGTDGHVVLQARMETDRTNGSKRDVTASAIARQIANFVENSTALQFKAAAEILAGSRPG